MAEPLFSSPTEASAFCATLTGPAAEWSVAHYTTTESTNELAVAAARSGAPHGTTFTADKQTAGRGRRGRSWHSPRGQGLLFSTVVRGTGLTPERLGWVALSAGHACAEAIRIHADIDVRLKWPNDLVVVPGKGKHPPWLKLGGILVESSLTEGMEAAYAVVGVGINVLHDVPDLPGDARTPPTSLRLLAHRKLSRKNVFRRILKQLSKHLAWTRDGAAFTEVSDQIRNAFAHWWNGYDLHVYTVGGERNGVFAGLDHLGRLCLRDAQHGIETLSDAEWLDAQQINP